MRFTTGGAVVLAGETRTTGDEPSTTRSHTDLQGLRGRHSQYLKGSQQQEQDEIELNPHAIDRSASATRISNEDDGHDSIGSCVASQGGIHVSRQYEVFTEGVKSRAETRNIAFQPYSKAAVTSDGGL